MLGQVLSGLPIPSDSRILTKFDQAEDAAVYQISEDRALVSTMDVITPLVDDPLSFGRIAASNAISDVFAMGARPLFSLSFLGTPKGMEPLIARDILAGGGELALAAGAPILGGHSVETEDLLFGLAVIGEVDPKELWTNDKLRPGLELILTKPLGTGTLTTMLKRTGKDASLIAEAIEGMEQTHAEVLPTLRKFGAITATDVTGFGFLGHAAEMAHASDVGLDICVSDLPEYAGAKRSLDDGFVTRANQRNLSYVESMLGPIAGEVTPLLLDPQTAGGLLVAIRPESLMPCLNELRGQGCIKIARVGRVREGAGITLLA